MACQREKAATLVDPAPLFIADLAAMPGNGRVAEPGFVLVIPGNGVIMIIARFGLPPGIDEGHRFLPIVL